MSVTRLLALPLIQDARAGTPFDKFPSKTKMQTLETKYLQEIRVPITAMPDKTVVTVYA